MKEHRIKKGNGVLVRLEDAIDIGDVVLWASFSVRREAIKCARDGFLGLAMMYYRQWRKLTVAYRTLNDAERWGFGSWRRVGWFER